MASEYEMLPVEEPTHIELEPPLEPPKTWAEGTVSLRSSRNLTEEAEREARLRLIRVKHRRGVVIKRGLAGLSVLCLALVIAALESGGADSVASPRLVGTDTAAAIPKSATKNRLEPASTPKVSARKRQKARRRHAGPRERGDSIRVRDEPLTAVPSTAAPIPSPSPPAPAPTPVHQPAPADSTPTNPTAPLETRSAESEAEFGFEH
jgi:hypothetical protein